MPLVRMKAALPFLCLFTSGFAGLVYEVCAIRRCALAFGSTTLAVSTVIAVFFGGLALGSWLLGRLAARVRRPLRTYAILELGVAAAALLTPPAMAWAEALYGHLYRTLPAASVLLPLARLALAACVILPASVLMGGTLPLFARHCVSHAQDVARPVGALYAVNTLGAAAGCAATGFWLLPWLGIQGSFLSGAGLSAAAGLLAAGLRAAAPIAARDARARSRAAPDPSARPRRAAVGAIFFATGFAALGTEILWTRFLALILRNTVYTYTLTLTVVLLGIVLGSLLAAWLFDRRWPRAALFGALQILFGLSALALMLLPAELWRSLQHEISVCLVLMLLPAILSGAAFPLAVRMVLDDPVLVGRDVGTLLALNTSGGLLGALLCGTAALPLLGLHATLLWLSGIAVAAGVLAWMALHPRSAQRRRALLAAVPAAGLWLGLPAILGTRLPQDHLVERGTLIDHREGRASTVAVVAHEGVRRMEIDRWWQGQDLKNHQIMAAHVPALLHGGPRRVLVIGAGAGQTPMRFLMHGARQLDCVDIEPAVFELLAAHFDSGWMRDPRVRLIREDGRSFIAHGAEIYDIVSIEVGQLFRPGVATFYTADFYRLAAARLDEGGLLVQFLPLPFFTPEEFRGVVATFLQVFPASVLWYNTSELLLIGAKGPPPALPPERLRTLRDDPAIHEDLRYSHWGGPGQWLNQPGPFLAGFLCGPPGLAAMSRGGAIYRDDHPVLEYATSTAQPQDAREVALLDLLRAHLDAVESIAPQGLAGAMAVAIEDMRRRNLGDIAAAAFLRQEEILGPGLTPAQRLALFAEALRRNPMNVVANRRMANGLVLAGQVAAAEPFFRAALDVSDADALAHKGLGFVLIQTGRPADAVPHLRAAIASGAEDATAHNYLGVALAQGGDLASARRAFQRALELDPADADARQNLERVGPGP
jgi:spermidine synthase